MEETEGEQKAIDASLARRRDALDLELGEFSGWGGDMAALSNDYVIADIETTGFHPKRGAEIIRIDALKFTDTDKRRRYRALVRPRRKLPKEVLAITGITQEQLNKKGEPLTMALDGFFRFARGRRVVVIFGADFEVPFWKAATRRCGMAMPSPIVCARSMAKKAWPEMERYNARYLAARVPAVKKRALHLRSDVALQAAIYEAARRSYAFAR
jgi:DNA polymerase III epsilon subunit-like protein